MEASSASTKTTQQMDNTDPTEAPPAFTEILDPPPPYTRTLSEAQVLPQTQPHHPTTSSTISSSSSSTAKPFTASTSSSSSSTTSPPFNATYGADEYVLSRVRARARENRLEREKEQLKQTIYRDRHPRDPSVHPLLAWGLSTWWKNVDRDRKIGEFKHRG